MWGATFEYTPPRTWIVIIMIIQNSIIYQLKIIMMSSCPTVEYVYYSLSEFLINTPSWTQVDEYASNSVKE